MIPRPPRSASGSSLSRLLRTTGVVIVFACAGLLFWKQFALVPGGLLGDGTVLDQSGRLTRQQKESIHDFAQALSQGFGLDFRLEVRTGSPAEPEAGAGTLCLSLYPEQREALAAFPVLLAEALPRSDLKALREGFFEPYWQGGRWPQGLFAWMDALWRRLNALRSEKRDT